MGIAEVEEEFRRPINALPIVARAHAQATGRHRPARAGRCPLRRTPGARSSEIRRLAKALACRAIAFCLPMIPASGATWRCAR